MSESQSRYSIVERLTRTKLDIMSDKSNLKEEVTTKRQKITDLEKDLANYLEDYEVTKQREERQRKINIEKAQRDLKNAEERLSAKEKVLDDKIKTIEDSLKSIEEISKTSPTINK